MLDHMYQVGILRRDDNGEWLIDLGSQGKYKVPDQCRLQVSIGEYGWIDIVIRKGNYGYSVDVPNVTLYEGMPTRVMGLQ